MRDYYKGLIAFRKQHPALRLRDIREIRERFSFYDIQKGESVVSFIDCNGVSEESVKEICLIFNPEQEELEICLPEGKWEIQVSDNIAGIKSLGEVEEKIRVSPISCMFLVRK